MRETSELDCMMVVLTTPNAMLFLCVSVKRRRSSSSVPPVKALNPSSSDNMPNIKSDSPAAIVLKSGLIQKL